MMRRIAPTPSNPEINLSLLLSLPRDILIYILSFLPKDRSELINLTTTCKTLYPLRTHTQVSMMFPPPQYNYSTIRYKAGIRVERVRVAALSPDGSKCAVSIDSLKGQIQIYDGVTGRLLKLFYANYERNSAYNGLCYSSNGNYLVAINERNIDVFNMKTGIREGYFENVSKRLDLLIAAISPHEFVIGNKDTPLHIYNVSTGSCRRLTDSADQEIKPMTTSPDGSRLVFPEEIPQGIKPWSMTASPDGSRLVFQEKIPGKETPRLSIFNLVTKQIHRITNAPSEIQNIVLSADHCFIYFHRVDTLTDGRTYHVIKLDIRNETDAGSEQIIGSTSCGIQSLKICFRTKTFAYIKKSYDSSGYYTNLSTVCRMPDPHETLYDGTSWRGVSYGIEPYCSDFFISPDAGRFISIVDRDTSNPTPEKRREINTIVITKFPISDLPAKPTLKP